VTKTKVSVLGQSSNQDIKEMLADVQAPSVLHFENMEMGLFQELKKSKGTGWGVLSEIVHKYPKHQSLQVAISKLKA